jgi:hypothetical protein
VAIEAAYPTHKQIASRKACRRIRLQFSQFIWPSYAGWVCIGWTIESNHNELKIWDRSTFSEELGSELTRLVKFILGKKFRQHEDEAAVSN